MVQPVDQESDLDRPNQNWKNQHSAKIYWSKLKKKLIKNQVKSRTSLIFKTMPIVVGCRHPKKIHNFKQLALAPKGPLTTKCKNTVILM